MPVMRLITEANQLRLYNKAVGTSRTTLDDLPTDHVAAVLAWATEISKQGGL